MAITLEVGKVYRDREGNLVTILPQKGGIPVYSFFGDNFVSYTLDGKCLENSEDPKDLVEEASAFRTQQEIWGYIGKGGYIRYPPINDAIVGFYNGTTCKLDNYGELIGEADLYFKTPSQWVVAYLQPKPEPKWYDNIPEQGILCWVDDYYKDRKLITGLKVVIAYEPEIDKPFIVYRSEAAGTVSYKYATPATLDELSKYIYELE